MRYYDEKANVKKVHKSRFQLFYRIDKFYKNMFSSLGKPYFFTNITGISFDSPLPDTQ